MPRVKITEYRAKKLLLEESYRGLLIRTGEPVKLPKSGRWAVKVDQGVKQRMKKGLVLLDQSGREVSRAISKLRKKGFSQFLVEPFLNHKKGNEQYISFERVREGIRFMHAASGGIDIESNPEAVKTYILNNDSALEATSKKTKLPQSFLKRLLDVFKNNFFAFLEINPLVVMNGKTYLLDAAVLVDSAGAFFARSGWTEADIIPPKLAYPAEKRIEELARTSPASFKLNVLNPNGSLFFLLSGGGGSIVIADEAELRGTGKEIGNYGEYSGGPTKEETYLYAKEVIALLLKSRAKRKALIIAGGVANFTDIKQTFSGIIDALSQAAPLLRKAGVKVFVRRGGPNEEEGLLLMRTFLKKERIFGTVYGSETIITRPVADAINFIKTGK